MISTDDTLTSSEFEIAIRDGISVSEVSTLLKRWIAPQYACYARARTLALMNDPAWQAWRTHYHELLQLGYYGSDWT